MIERYGAVDGNGTIHVVMQCGGTAYVMTSRSRGVTYSAPFALSAATESVSQVAIGAGPTGVAYAAIILNDGTVYLRTTADFGVTWSAANVVGATTGPSSGLSLESFNDTVYVGYATSDGVAVAVNTTRGIGTFRTTPVAMSIAYFDLMYDVALGTLVVAADTPGFHVRASTDGGATFGAEVNPPGQEFFSDWALGNGRIFAVGVNIGASGDSNRIYVIPTSAPSTSTAVFGLPTVTSAQTRTVAADLAGNAFVASQLDGGGVRLDRLPSARLRSIPRARFRRPAPRRSWRRSRARGARRSSSRSAPACTRPSRPTESCVDRLTLPCVPEVGTPVRVSNRAGTATERRSPRGGRRSVRFRRSQSYILWARTNSSTASLSIAE